MKDIYARVAELIEFKRHRKALSQGYEPGIDPYAFNPSDDPTFEFRLETDFHAIEAAGTIVFVDDAHVRRGWGRPVETGPDAAAQARYSAIVLEGDRETVALDLLREAINLAAVGDIDETVDDGLGWGDWVRRAKAVEAAS